MRVEIYLIGPPLRAPVAIGIARSATDRWRFLQSVSKIELRLHDFARLTPADASRLMGLLHATLRPYHLGGERFDLAPAHAQRVFRAAIEALQDAA